MVNAKALEVRQWMQKAEHDLLAALFLPTEKRTFATSLLPMCLRNNWAAAWVYDGVVTE